jgi:hypothetical protein
MSRHPFSRRAHRRRRTGVPPGARSIEECDAGRWSSGRRGGWEPKSGDKEYLTFRINDVD